MASRVSELTRPRHLAATSPPPRRHLAATSPPPRRLAHLTARLSHDLLVVRNSINELDADEISAVFRAFDHDKSGDLDTFELAAAISNLLGKAPSTGQMVRTMFNAYTLPPPRHPQPSPPVVPPPHPHPRSPPIHLPTASPPSPPSPPLGRSPS